MASEPHRKVAALPPRPIPPYWRPSRLPWRNTRRLGPAPPAVVTGYGTDSASSWGRKAESNPSPPPRAALCGPFLSWRHQ
jgi:hypothetical protein